MGYFLSNATPIEFGTGSRFGALSICPPGSDGITGHLIRKTQKTLVCSAYMSSKGGSMDNRSQSGFNANSSS